MSSSFLIGDQIGRGGTGVVHRAVDTAGREVALKLLTRSDPTTLERFGHWLVAVMLCEQPAQERGRSRYDFRSKAENDERDAYPTEGFRYRTLDVRRQRGDSPPSDRKLFVKSRAT